MRGGKNGEGRKITQPPHQKNKEEKSSLLHRAVWDHPTLRPGAKHIVRGGRKLLCQMCKLGCENHFGGKNGGVQAKDTGGKDSSTGNRQGEPGVGGGEEKGPLSRATKQHGGKKDGSMYPQRNRRGGQAGVAPEGV